MFLQFSLLILTLCDQKTDLGEMSQKFMPQGLAMVKAGRNLHAGTRPLE